MNSLCYIYDFKQYSRLDDGISPQVLLEMSESEIDRQGFSYGGAKVLKKTLKELKVRTKSLFKLKKYILKL